MHEINKPMSSEEEQKFKEAVVLEAQTNAQKQLNEAKLNNRRQMFALAKAKANNDYYDSKEMKALNDQITNLEISTNNCQRQIEERNIMAMAQKKNNEEMIAHNVNSQFVKGNLSAVEQVSYLIDNEVTPKLDEFNEKHTLILKLNALHKIHPDEWDIFIAQNGKLPGLLDNECYLDIDINEIKGIVDMFDSFLKQQQQFQLQMADAPLNVDSDDLFNFND